MKNLLQFLIALMLFLLYVVIMIILTIFRSFSKKGVYLEAFVMEKIDKLCE